MPDASSSKISSGTSQTVADNSPATAAAYVRACCEAGREGSPPAGKRQSQRYALSEWALLNNIRADSYSVHGLQPVRPGAEHSVYIDKPAKLVVKLTHPGGFGWSLHGEGEKATPFEYLERLAWQNHLFGDAIAILAVIGDEKIMQVVTSQPYIYENEDDPDVTLEEIDQFFESRRFYKVLLNPEAPWFYNLDLKIAIGDGHPGNFIRNEAGEIVPIDLVIGVPGPALATMILDAIGKDSSL